MLGCENAVKFYRTSAVEYLFDGTSVARFGNTNLHSRDSIEFPRRRSQ